MSYISEFVECRPFKDELDIKIKEAIEKKNKEGYELISRSYVGKAFAILVFGKTA